MNNNLEGKVLKTVADQESNDEGRTTDRKLVPRCIREVITNVSSMPHHQKSKKERRNFNRTTSDFDEIIVFVHCDARVPQILGKSDHWFHRRSPKNVGFSEKILNPNYLWNY